jgi:membrane protein required for colicin V production
MNWLDIVILVLLAAAVFGGIRNGLIKSLCSLIGLIVGVVLAGRFYTSFANVLSFISNEDIAKIVAFIIIFLIVTIIAAILGNILTKVISAIRLGGVKRVGGGIFGFLLGAITIGALLTLFIKFTGMGDFIGGSALANFLVDKLPIVLGLLPKEFDTITNFFE